MHFTATKIFKIIKILIEINFCIFACLLIAGGILSVSDHYSLFDFNADLYGALQNNLRLALVFLAISEAFIVGYCLLTNKFEIMMGVGFFLILMIGSLTFYGEINEIEIDPAIPEFFLYAGLSHIIFGLMVVIEKNNANRRHFL